MTITLDEATARLMGWSRPLDLISSARPRTPSTSKKRTGSWGSPTTGPRC